MRKKSVAREASARYSFDRSDASLSTPFLRRLRRSARKIKSAANSRATRAMIHEMATTPVPGQFSNTRPTTATAPYSVTPLGLPFSAFHDKYEVRDVVPRVMNAD